MWKIARFILLVAVQVGVAQGQPGCPQSCFCYPNYIAYCRNLDAMPVGLSPRTRGLLVADSTFTTLPKNAFMGLPYLVELNITETLLASIHPDAFNGLKKLEVLDLSNNKLKTFPGAAMAKLGKKLKSLNLGGNWLAGSLTADSFKGLEALEGLYLYNTNFTTIEEGLFASLKKLTVLDLSKNNFEALPEGAIKGLDNLKEIVMFGNPFTCDKDASWLSGWIEKNPPEIGAGPTCMDPPRFAGYAAAALSSEVLSAEYEMKLIDCNVEPTPPPDTPPGEDRPPPPVQAASIKGLVWKCPSTYVLKAGQFEEYTDLEELDISGNGIIDIEPGAFSSLNKLKVLYLSENSIKRIKPAVMNDLKSVEVLDVSGNKMSYLPADIKERLPKIKFIVGYNNPWSCDCNLAANMDLIAHYFHEIPAICAAPQELEGREVREVPEEAMTCTPPVITYIDEYVTVKEGGDAFLNCEIAGLPVPPAQWKTPDGKIVTIDEPVGNKEVLDNGTLWIKNAVADDGGNYVCIADNGGGIDMANATLRVCPRVCRCLDILTVHCFEADISKIPADTRLFLMLGTDLTEVKKDLFKDLKDLEELDLDNNQITDIEVGSFDGLENLRLLFLYRNALEKLASGLFKGMTNLLQIYLSSNNITTVEDGAFEGLENLQLIQLHENKIEEIGDGAFKGLPTLIDLDLHLNNLTTVPGKAITSLENLRRVQLFDNKIKIVKEDDFKGLESLQLIYLQNNDIQVIENGAFADLPDLQWLDLSNNKIVIIPAGVFKGLDALQRLDLSNNALVTLPASLRTELPSLRFVIGAGNPWHCDCNMIPLRGWFGYSPDQPPPQGAGPAQGDPPFRPYYEPDPLLLQEFLQRAGEGPFQPAGHYGGRRRRQAPGGFASCATPIAYANQDANTIPLSSLICEAILFVENGLAVLIGESAELPCNISKETGVGKFWATPQGAVVKFGGSVNKTKVAADGTLTIEKVAEEDAGAYVCVGGEEPVVYFLNYVKEVTTPPPPPTEPPKVEEEEEPPKLEPPEEVEPPPFPPRGVDEPPETFPDGGLLPAPPIGFPDFPDPGPPRQPPPGIRPFGGP
ncbi:PREDICTED: slit homolog 2 protein-like [Branchiostoma belcheri]|uniref:Slit homolog 2 protein-like n=1 Tax=Branchiostoma belcheri TaxID=7741 RepID=A0A6P4YQH9_BRABE|nr:PREDICTED: slit homolog 2 protein-like [Branchiostoma belcheri]